MSFLDPRVSYRSYDFTIVDGPSWDSAIPRAVPSQYLEQILKREDDGSVPFGHVNIDHSPD